MKITVLVEGRTEKAFLPILRTFLKNRLAERMPNIDPYCYDGRIPTHGKLNRVVAALLIRGNPPSDAVIALTDVYTGTREFQDAAHAKKLMREWVGPNDRFFPHVAQYDFEAWLLPYWDVIKNLARHNRKAPAGAPESVDHMKPPSFHIKEVFETGKGPRSYSKTRDAARILQGQDLGIAAQACPELRALLNTILSLSGGQPI